MISAITSTGHLVIWWRYLATKSLCFVILLWKPPTWVIFVRWPLLCNGLLIWPQGCRRVQEHRLQPCGQINKPLHSNGHLLSRVLNTLIGWRYLATKSLCYVILPSDRLLCHFCFKGVHFCLFSLTSAGCAERKSDPILEVAAFSEHSPPWRAPGAGQIHSAGYLPPGLHVRGGPPQLSLT
jgi:hypothetical protein